MHTLVQLWLFVAHSSTSLFWCMCINSSQKIVTRTIARESISIQLISRGIQVHFDPLQSSYCSDSRLVSGSAYLHTSNVWLWRNRVQPLFWVLYPPIHRREQLLLRRFHCTFPMCALLVSSNTEPKQHSEGSGQCAHVWLLHSPYTPVVVVGPLNNTKHNARRNANCIFFPFY